MIAPKQVQTSRRTVPVVPPDKATFGLVSTLLVGVNLATNYYIAKTAGAFLDLEVAITNPPVGSSSSLDILISSDFGGTWHSILSAPVTIPPATSQIFLSGAVWSSYNSIAPHDWLRVDGLTVGSSSPGSGIELVLRWQ